MKVNGSTVKLLREEQGLSVPELAKASGVSLQRLYDIENKTPNVTLKTINKIAAALKVDPRALLEE